jgi:hypothetical protein
VHFLPPSEIIIGFLKDFEQALRGCCCKTEVLQQPLVIVNFTERLTGKKPQKNADCVGIYLYGIPAVPFGAQPLYKPLDILPRVFA